MAKVGAIMGSDEQQNNAKYIILLTKADKNFAKKGNVAESVKQKLVDTMKANRVGYAPIVLTSAETRLGRDEVWKYLEHVVAACW